VTEKTSKPSKRSNAPPPRTREDVTPRRRPESPVTPDTAPGVGGASDRPTVNPPFDVEAYARAASGPSLVPHTSPDAPTNRPAPLPALPRFELGPGSEQASDQAESEGSSERITLTNEVELERARVQSAAATPPLRTVTSSVLSIANARAPSVPIVEARAASLPDETPDPHLAYPQAPGATGGLSPSRREAATPGAIRSPAPPEITERTIDDPIAEMRERFSLGDYTGALEMSELILAELPDDAEAARCAETCRTVLENMYAARIGPLDRIPMVTVPRTQMRWLSMDHRAGFILSLIDGSSSIEMILDLCGMPKLDAYRILLELVQQKIVSFR
jgi:hypothetical protein